jgi:hypothetical protein
MPGKVLSLDLKYQGKFLTYARSNSDFKGSKFFIGSDRNIFWQILDSTFPKQHLLVSKEGSKYQIHLTKGMSLNVQKGDQTLTPEDLKSKKILNGDTLTVDESTSGHISFLNDWEIDFAFRNVYAPSLTQEDIALMKQFSHYSQPDPTSRKVMFYSIIGTLITIVAISVLSTKYAYIGQMSAENMSLVRAVQAQVQQASLSDIGGGSDMSMGTSNAKQDEAEAAPAEDTPATVKGGGGGGGGGGPVSAKAVFGGGGGGGAHGATGFTANVSTRLGGATSGLYGSGSGNSGFSRTQVQGAFSAGSYGGGGGANSLGEMVSGGGLAGSGLRQMSAGAIAGSGGGGGIGTVKSDADFQALRSSFAGARRISGGGDKYSQGAGGTAGPSSSDANIIRYVSANKNRLERIFSMAKFKSSIYGSIQFEILIDNNQVKDVKITEMKNSKFTPEVKDAFRKEILTWRINSRERVSYSFVLNFS